MAGSKVIPSNFPSFPPHERGAGSQEGRKEGKLEGITLLPAIYLNLGGTNSRQNHSQNLDRITKSSYQKWGCPDPPDFNQGPSPQIVGLDWVDSDLWCSTILPSCSASSVNFPSALAEPGRGWNNQNQSQPKPNYPIRWTSLYLMKVTLCNSCCFFQRPHCPTRTVPSCSTAEESWVALTASRPLVSRNTRPNVKRGGPRSLPGTNWAESPWV